jgi:hypothetical protein
MKQTAVDLIFESFNLLSDKDFKTWMLHTYDYLKKMEKQQRGYTTEDVLKAGEMGEINHYDYKHIVSLLDEAKSYNWEIKKK